MTYIQIVIAVAMCFVIGRVLVSFVRLWRFRAVTLARNGNPRVLCLDQQSRIAYRLKQLDLPPSRRRA